MATVFAVTNQKGGVGKTTTAVNLSACLATTGRETLIVDLDPQGNATSGLGIDTSEVQQSVYDVLLDGLAVEKVLRDSEIPSLKVLASNSDLTSAELNLASSIAREGRLGRALSPIKGRFYYIFVDCPPSLGLLTVNALAASDEVIIPVQCEYYALEGLNQLLQMVELVRRNLNPTLTVGGVLLTMADRRTLLCEQVIREVRNFFGEKVFRTIIPRNVRLSEAPSFGKPVILYDERAPGAVAYKELAEELMSRG